MLQKWSAFSHDITYLKAKEFELKICIWKTNFVLPQKLLQIFV